MLQQFEDIRNQKPHKAEGVHDVEVHVLTCEKHILRTLWSLSSFYKRSGLKPLYHIHDDGTLTQKSIDDLKRLFPFAFIFKDKDVEEKILGYLEGYPFCTDFRKRQILSRKIFDFTFLRESNYIVSFDTDCLWFHQSPVMNEYIKKQIPFYIGGGGGGESYCLEPGYIRGELGLQPAWNVNSGTFGIPATTDFINLDFIEECLDKFTRNLHRDLNWYLVEQTLYALLFRRNLRTKSIDHMGYLDTDPMEHRFAKDCNSNPITYKTAYCHFVGDAGYMGFFTQGVQYLLEDGFMELEEKPGKPKAIATRVITEEELSHLEEVAEGVDDFWIQAEEDIRGETSRGSYRYLLYLYSNLFEKVERGLTLAEKTSLIKMYKKFKYEHSLNWVRTKLIELDIDKILNLEAYLYNCIGKTDNFVEFKIALYLLNQIRNRQYYADDYILDKMPNIKRYVRMTDAEESDQEESPAETAETR